MNGAQFLEELRGLCGAAATGMMFVVTGDNRQARIGLLDGRIVHIALFPQRGSTALNTLASSGANTFRFQDGPAPAAHDDLPATPAILEILRGGGNKSGGNGGGAARQTAVVDAGQLRVVEQELAEQLGPIAGILVEEAGVGGVPLDDLLRALSTHFDNTADAEKFIQRVRQRLR